MKKRDELEEENKLIGAKCGSPKFNNFLTSIGSIIPTQELTFYSGGLDTTREEADGKFAVVWMSDNVKDNIGSGNSMLVFHVPTMMPENYNNRKRHVGNDPVHIIYSEESVVLNSRVAQGKVSGQFGIVQIFVMPVVGEGGGGSGSGSGSGEAYRVELVCEKEELGYLRGASIVGRGFVGEFVRNLAIKADLGIRCSVAELSDHSNWEERVLQIQRLGNG